MKNILRWSLLVGGIACGFIYLNSAAYRAWLAGGPPTENAEGWFFGAANHLSWGSALVFGGVGLFILIKHLPQINRLALLLVFFAVGLGLLPFAREFLAADQCLDSGGRWSAQELRCAYK